MLSWHSYLQQMEKVNLHEHKLPNAFHPYTTIHMLIAPLKPSQDYQTF